MTLTARRRQVLGAIAAHRGPAAPTAREIGAAVGLASTDSVHYQFTVLKRDGWIEWEPKIPGSLRLANGVFVELHHLVLVEHCPSCEMTLPADHHCERDLKVSIDWTPAGGGE